MSLLWKKYSFAIILIVMSLAMGLYMVFSLEEESRYSKIVVSDGETLWSIADQYAGSHGMTKQQFVKWVEDRNGIAGDFLRNGEELIIPVKAPDYSGGLNEIAFESK